jgi:hypothetical protein
MIKGEATMPSEHTERALELRAGDILFYSSSDPESWLIKWGQTLLHKERADTTHAAIAVAPRLILEANPKGLEENEKGVVEETVLAYPKDFEKIRYVFRNPDKKESNISGDISRAAMFFRGERYDYLKIFASQLLQPLKKTRGAEQYGKTFCSALVQRVAEKSNLIRPHPTGKLLSPHALMKYLKTLGWEQIEGARFIRSAAEEEEDREAQKKLLVIARLDRGIVERANRLDANFASRVKELMSSGEPVWRAMLPLLTAKHRVLAERQQLENMLKQVHPDRHKALEILLDRYSDQPDRLRKIVPLAASAHYFPLDLLNMAPLVSQLQSIQTITCNVGHYSIANEMDILEKMRREAIKWLTDEVEVYEQEAHTQITESKFYEVFELYLSDNIEEKMRKDTELRDAMAKWEKGIDQAATLTMQITLVKGLSLSTSREKLLELKNLCTSVLVDEKLRSRAENLLAERENYLGILENWLKARSAQVGDLSMDSPQTFRA